MEKADFHWLVGLLEGEGSFFFVKRPTIAVEMTDEDVIQRVASLFGVGYVTSDRKPGVWKRSFRTSLRGRRAADLMTEMKPFLSLRRQGQISTTLEGYVKPAPNLTEEQAIEMAQRYWAGERSPTKLGKEYGISKNNAIYYINKHAAEVH